MSDAGNPRVQRLRPPLAGHPLPRNPRWQAQPVPPRVHIGYIYVHPNVDAKITRRAQGGCTQEEVREAFQGSPTPADLSKRPSTEPTEIAGFGETGTGKRLFASFVALDEADGTWSLMTAWPV